MQAQYVVEMQAQSAALCKKGTSKQKQPYGASLFWQQNLPHPNERQIASDRTNARDVDCDMASTAL